MTLSPGNDFIIRECIQSAKEHPLSVEANTGFIYTLPVKHTNIGFVSRGIWLNSHGKSSPHWGEEVQQIALCSMLACK